MKVKRKYKETYSEWYAKQEDIERTNRGRDKVKRKVLGEKAQYEQRFTDAVREYHDQKYRKATAKLVARMFNNLLVKVHGTFMQRAKQTIVINTSVSQVVIQTNTRGLNKKGKFGWKMQASGSLSMKEFEAERREVVIEMNRLFNRVKRREASEVLPHNSKMQIGSYLTDRPYDLSKLHPNFWESKMDVTPLPQTNQNLRKGLGE